MPAPRTPVDAVSTNLGQSSLREANLALVLRTVVASPTPMSRAGVAGVTTLTRSTVSRLVDDLIAAGFLEEQSVTASAGPGRPGTPLLPSGRRHAALGLQVNVGMLAVRLVDLTGAVVGERSERCDLAGSDPVVTLRRLGSMALDALSFRDPGLEVVGTGIALPGIVDTRSGRLLNAPNLGWSDVDCSGLLGEFGLGSAPVRVGNEADLSAVSAAHRAPGRPDRLVDFVYLSGEIGIGGAIVLGGEVVGGRHGWAGEIGHVCVDPNGPPCRCGSTGCLEQYAGRLALMAAAGLGPTASPEELEARVLDGEARPGQAVLDAADALAVALGGVLNVVDIPTIVLGGHLGQLAHLLTDRLTTRLQDRVIWAGRVNPVIIRADADAAAGARGAALLELQQVLAAPTRWMG